MEQGGVAFRARYLYFWHLGIGPGGSEGAARPLWIQRNIPHGEAGKQAPTLSLQKIRPRHLPTDVASQLLGAQCETAGGISECMGPSSGPGAAPRMKAGTDQGSGPLRRL